MDCCESQNHCLSKCIYGRWGPHNVAGLERKRKLRDGKLIGVVKLWPVHDVLLEMVTESKHTVAAMEVLPFVTQRRF